MGLPSTLDEGTHKLKPLPEGTATHPKDSKGNKQPLDRDITFMTPDEGTVKTTSRSKGSLRDKDSGGNKPPADMKPQNPTNADLSGTGAKYQEDQNQSSRLRYQSLTGNEVVHYENLKAFIDDYYNENIAHKDQIDQLVEASMRSFEKSSTIITDLYKGLEVITQLLKDIKNLVKDDSATNKKIRKPLRPLPRSLHRLPRFSLQSGALISLLFSLLISGLERAQTHIKSSMSSLKKDTSSVKSMMTEMYNAFRGQSSLAPSSSVTLTFALTDTLANVEGKNANHTTIKEPHSHTKMETDDNIQEKPEEPNQSIDANIKFIGSSTHPPSITQAPIIIVTTEKILANLIFYLMYTYFI
nr:hypothetical protein [Tanacetum cinerariifolium]